MALPLNGAWKTQANASYAGASVWGTGASPIFGIYGEGPPVRTTGRNDAEPQIQPIDRSVDQTAQGDLWGYETTENWRDTDFYPDDRPTWNEQPPQYRSNVDKHPSWNASQGVRNAFRSMWGGAHRINQKAVDSLPSETVSEGWLNKIGSKVADARPSASEQIFVQTSMRQRYGTRTNTRAELRNTDASRSPIHSRVEPMVAKQYSTGERLYDMFPFQQDVILRPFRYRLAGTDDPVKMAPNMMYISSPVERIPPPDPSLGIPEPAGTGSEYGYTDEDNFYA